LIRLSRLADYGIVLMTVLARAEGMPRATSEVAQVSAVPQPMASKILKLLARAGLLGSQRGAHGGYALARPAAMISVADIIEALDGPIALTTCLEPHPGECGIESVCPTRESWQRINGAIRDALAGVSLAELRDTIPAAFLTPGERVARAAGSSLASLRQQSIGA
jgi:FeS assembly SUF system regulator